MHECSEPQCTRPHDRLVDDMRNRPRSPRVSLVRAQLYRYFEVAQGPSGGLLGGGGRATLPPPPVPLANRIELHKLLA